MQDPPLNSRERFAPMSDDSTSDPSCADSLSDDLSGEQVAMDFSAFAQPIGQDGVIEDMATLAVNPGLGGGILPQGGTLPAPRGRTAQALACAGTIPDSSELSPSVAQGLNSVDQSSAHFAQIDDAAIMLELRAGNMSGFDFLLQKYRKQIVNFMYRMVHNQAIAEELAQEVFLRVYRSRETYRAEARFSTWLYRIATNLGVNYARDTHNERAASTVYLDEADPETGSTPDLADSTVGAETELLRRERSNAIRQHVLALPERQRMAVLMHKYEGMDYRQIGDVLKLSESGTKSLLFRAYQTLRERLHEFI